MNNYLYSILWLLSWPVMIFLVYILAVWVLKKLGLMGDSDSGN